MTEAEPIDLLLNARWVLPIVPAGQVFEACSVAIDKGRILAIVPTATAGNVYRARQTVDLGQHVLMPGLVNAHGHAAMSLLRGFADDLPLDIWLRERIWPAEGQWVSPEFVRDGTELALAEMLASGTTCFVDMYFFPEQTAAVAHELGMRAHIAFPVLDFATPWSADADDAIHKGLALHDTYRSVDLINIGFGPHAPYTVADGALQRIATLAEELQTSIHIHLHETAEEIATSLKTFNKRPIERLAELGVLTPDTQCVHMTQLTDGDIELVKTYGSSVVHCPQSNLKLASGLCPVQRLLAQGIEVALGTDGAASNNGLHMLAEMNVAALIGKIAAADAAAVSSHEVLHSATLGGARALGLGETIGSMEPGKQADLIAIELKGPGSEPTFEIASHLIYNNRNAEVTHTWVAGNNLYERGHYTGLCLADVHRKARNWGAKIKSKAK